MLSRSFLSSNLVNALGKPPRRKRVIRRKKRKGAFQVDLNRDAYDASLAAYGEADADAHLIQRGWIQDPELSGKNYLTYTRGGKALVAFRGTASLDDLAPDLGILNNDFSGPEFAEATNIVQAAKQKYGSVTTTGHSLGGTKALKAANEDIHAIVFNPGAGVKPLETGGHTVFQANMDPISSNLKGENIHGVWGGHSLANFEGHFY